MVNFNKQVPQFYRVWFDDSDPQAMISDEEDLKGMNEWVVFEGNRIANWPEGVEFYVEGEHKQDYLFSSLSGWILVSDRVRAALEECNIKGVEYLPVTVKDKTRRFKIGTYWVMNILNAVEAINWQATRWMNPKTIDQDPYPALNILTEVLEEQAIENLDVFLLSVRGDITTRTYVSSRFKSCLQHALAHSGFKFVPVSVQ